MRHSVESILKIHHIGHKVHKGKFEDELRAFDFSMDFLSEILRGINFLCDLGVFAVKRPLCGAVIRDIVPAG